MVAFHAELLIAHLQYTSYPKVITWSDTLHLYLVFHSTQPLASLILYTQYIIPRMEGNDY